MSDRIVSSSLFRRGMSKRFSILISLSLGLVCGAGAASAPELFQQGNQAYIAGGFEQASVLFREAASAAPSAGTLQNLGNAEWQCGRAGAAILAWERSQWLDPFNHNTRANLRYARKVRQLDTPELTWYEVCSAWLPVNSWAWIACLSFWATVAMMMLPNIFRWRKADWHQGLAVVGFVVFLLTIPALVGVHTRSHLGIIVPKDTPLRLTPTSEAQVLSKLPAGEAVRLERTRGNYVFIRTSVASGWVESAQFGRIATRQISQ
ncbi:MAG: hypothetical protein JWR26_1724 [Pedosphaera sp.]|nr:hypothetical protein [Pedosphaera sp.]